MVTNSTEIQRRKMQMKFEKCAGDGQGSCKGVAEKGIPPEILSFSEGELKRFCDDFVKAIVEFLEDINNAATKPDT